MLTLTYDLVSCLAERAYVGRRGEWSPVTTAMFAEAGVTVTDLTARFAKLDIRSTRTGSRDVPYPHVHRSSVLVPLFYRNGQLNVLLTIRSPNLRQHASAAAFPGGRKDDGDMDDGDTALREAEEEVGLPRSQVHVIGYLPPCFVRPAYAMFPVVGLIPEKFRPRPNQHEVALVFSVPLARFLREDFETMDVEYSGLKIKVYYFECETDQGPVTVWGVTARLCMMTASIAFQLDTMESILGGKGPLEDAMKTDNEVFVHMCEKTKPAKL